MAQRWPDTVKKPNYTKEFGHFCFFKQPKLNYGNKKNKQKIAFVASDTIFFLGI